MKKTKEKEGVSMRTIQAAAITETVAKLCIQIRRDFFFP